MNLEFGMELRRELVKLMRDSSGPRIRAHSVDSQRLSLDSLEGRPGDRRNKKDDSAEVYDQIDWAS
jgi:hypothetical protein